MLLSDLKTGEKAVILKVSGHGAFHRRILEMGFVRGKEVTVLLDAPLRDPVKYKIMDYEVSLRRSEARMIHVITMEEAADLARMGGGGDIIEGDTPDKIIDASKKVIRIALVGNPNSGKTSLFNAASGSHEHVGNYSGVTVDAKRGRFHHRGYRFDIYDLPGTYALSAYSPEELYVRRHLTESMPDVVVNVVAASNLERNLYLTTELIDMDCTTVMALNMYDELEASGAELRYDQLGRMLGIPIVPTISKTGKGIARLFDTIIAVYENTDTTVRHIHITHNPEVEQGIRVLSSQIMEDGTHPRQFSPRYLAIKMLEADSEVERMLSQTGGYPELERLRDSEVARIEHDLGTDIETAVADDKYGFISGALQETYSPGKGQELESTRLIDSIVTHKLFGFPIFLFFMWLMFEATFSLGGYPMEWIEQGVAALAGFINNIMPEGMLKDLVADGIIGGVGGVIVFLPNILILYLFISFMEDSGYMARAAFIMDKLMHRMGLHGKSFIPLIMGFGCNVPAIMASRSIESHSSRLITILINPFMSCSARLPVYVLLIGAFFPAYASLVFLGLYIFGIVIAIVTAKLLRRFVFQKDETPFVMELPPYRMPTWKSVLRHMWEKAAQYLRKMGGIILIASIVVWFLSYFPTQVPERILDTARVEYEQSEQVRVKKSMDSAQGVDQAEETDPGEIKYEYAKQRNSYMGRMGQAIAPVMEPLGFDWKNSVALLSGMAAKEIIVSTLGVLYSEVDAEEDATGLAAKLHAPDAMTGNPAMTPLSALSFLVFALLYFPCIAAIVAIARESGSWKWAGFSFVYNTAVAWIMAWLVYNIGSLFV